MIKVIRGNLLDVEKGIIVHGCNAQGVMGSGIALQVKERWPDAFKIYKHFINYPYDKRHTLGFNVPYHVNDSKIIINAIIQEFYGHDKKYVSYDAIEECFSKLNTYIESNNLYHLPVCFPKIGCGLGGGNWNVVSILIDQTLSYKLEKRLYVV